MTKISERSNKYGVVKRVVGPVVDVYFKGEIPSINNKLLIDPEGMRLAAEVQQHLAGGLVRTLVLGPVEGLRRGVEVTDTGGPIKVPVGKQVLGRIFNVLGEPVDGLGDVKSEEYHSIHKSAPALVEQKTTPEVFETGIKVIDLICPFIKGGKVARRFFGFCRCRRAFERRKRPLS